MADPIDPAELKAQNDQQQREIDANRNKTAELEAKHDTNAEKIDTTAKKADTAAAKADAVGGWGAFVKTPLGIAVNALALAFVGSLTAFFMGYAKDGHVNLTLPTIDVRIVEMPKVADTKPKAAKLVIISTAATSSQVVAAMADAALQKAVKEAGVSIGVDSPSPDGSTYRFGGMEMALPVAVLRDEGGKDMDARALADAGQMLRVK